MELKIGDRLLIDGYPATVVAIPDAGIFGPKYPVEEWHEIWPTGLAVEDDQAGLVYYPDLEGLHIETLA